MKITVECKCGNKVEILPQTVGKVAYFASDLSDEDFYLNDVRIDKELFSENVTDPDDVGAKLNNCASHSRYFQ